MILFIATRIFIIVLLTQAVNVLSKLNNDNCHYDQFTYY